MTKELLIITAVLVLFIAIAPIVVNALLLKKMENNELIKKTLTTILTINGIVLLIIVSLWITPIKNNEIKISSSNTSNEEKEDDESDALSSAGFSELTLDSYLSLIKTDTKSLILIARPTCSYCQKFTPILKEAKENMNLTVNYLDTDNLDEEGWSTLSASLDYLKEEDWGTPLLLVVQNGKVIDANNGYVELDELTTFLNDNGYGK